MHDMSRTIFMMPILCVILVLCACPAKEEGPETAWGHIIGGSGCDTGQAVAVTSDGGYIVAGYTDSYIVGESRIYLIRLDEDGDTLWTDTHGSVPLQAFDIIQTSDGNYLVTGHEPGSGGGDVFCMKINEDGSVLWENTYGGTGSDIGFAAAPTADGGGLVCGWTVADSTGSKNVYIVRIDGNGDTLWTRNYGGAEDDFGTALCPVDNGGFVVTGWTESYGGGSDDIYLLRLDDNGDTLWTRTYGDQNQDYGEGVIQNHEGNYMVCGVIQDADEAMSRIFLFQVDANGDSVWLQTYDDGFAYDVAQADDNGYVLAGSHFYSFPDRNAYVLRTDINGLALWEKSFGDDANDGGYEVIQTGDGGFLMVGETESFGAGSRDVYIMKIAPESE
jgi:hypothetical protein